MGRSGYGHTEAIRIDRPAEGIGMPETLAKLQAEAEFSPSPSVEGVELGPHQPLIDAGKFRSQRLRLAGELAAFGSFEPLVRQLRPRSVLADRFQLGRHLFALGPQPGDLGRRVAAAPEPAHDAAELRPSAASTTASASASSPCAVAPLTPIAPITPSVLVVPVA